MPTLEDNIITYMIGLRRFAASRFGGDATRMLAGCKAHDAVRRYFDRVVDGIAKARDRGRWPSWRTKVTTLSPRIRRAAQNLRFALTSMRSAFPPNGTTCRQRPRPPSRATCLQGDELCRQACGVTWAKQHPSAASPLSPGPQSERLRCARDSAETSPW